MDSIERKGRYNLDSQPNVPSSQFKDAKGGEVPQSKTVDHLIMGKPNNRVRSDGDSIRGDSSIMSVPSSEGWFNDADTSHTPLQTSHSSNIPTPYNGGKKKLVMFMVGILAVGGGALGTMYLNGFFDSDDKEFLLGGEWTESNGNAFKIRNNGDMAEYGCDDASWSITSNETSFYYDCTSISPDGEEIWRETTYSFVIDGDVVVLKHLSVKNQDGLQHYPNDAPCIAWVASSVASNAEEWNQTVSSIVMPSMCQSINDL